MDLFNYQLKCTILLISFQLQLCRWAKSSKNWIKNNPGMGQTKAMKFCIFNTCQLDRLTRGGIPKRSWWGSTAGFPKSWPYFRPKNVIFHTRFLPGLKNSYPFWDVPKQKLCHHYLDQGLVARSLVSANRWLRGIKMYRFPWYLTLVSTNHASSNPGQNANKKILKIHFEFAYFSRFLLSYSCIPDTRPKWAKSLSVFRP